MILLQEYVDNKRKEHAALDKDYKAYAEAKSAMEAAKEKTKQAAEAVKGARAAVREALKTISDPPAVVRPCTRSFDSITSVSHSRSDIPPANAQVLS